MDWVHAFAHLYNAQWFRQEWHGLGINGIRKRCNCMTGTDVHHGSHFLAGGLYHQGGAHSIDCPSSAHHRRGRVVVGQHLAVRLFVESMIECQKHGEMEYQYM
jgi:hypothetical protein